MPSKLSFKGDKPKKKKRSHKESEDAGDELAAMAAGDPRGKSDITSTLFS
jgi:protein FRG1